jgi:hypothetical protein
VTGAGLREPGEKREGRAWRFDPDSGTLVPGPAPRGGTFGVLELPAKQFTVHRATDGEQVATVVATAGLRDSRGGRDLCYRRPRRAHAAAAQVGRRWVALQARTNAPPASVLELSGSHGLDERPEALSHDPRPTRLV